MQADIIIPLSISVPQLVAQEATVTDDVEPEPVAPVTDTSDESAFKGSPDVQAVVALVSPPYGLYTEKRDISLPAGKRASIVASLINTNDGTSLPRFSLDLVEGSLHYPGYYDYYIQNFTKIRLQNTLEPGQESTVSYSFKPALELAGRPFDLSVTAYYHDENGVYYAHSLFNQTVNLYEVEEGVDTELLFLGVLVVALCIVVLLGIWHWCSSKAAHLRVSPQTSKADLASGDKTVENEYLALIDNRKSTKPERNAQTVTRRHGKR
ncbi:hypothetical protein EG68_09542 [Paragonimus skrjabini miyazakii]|uniref:Translocon-associated protein subunit alpha n=1 Tax=Paragonimus skrjabini miyazakii TaxID=59628 RepID=A0A8S9YKY4_9TREM|nr:hypothetical protein EG68_09542 [Paragonimus skrjabini miyazakii]